MFKLQPNPTFKARVPLSVAGADRCPTVEIEFKYLDKDALQTYYAALAGKSDADALSEIVVGWSGIDAAFSPEALEQLLTNYPAAAHDLFTAYRREVVESKVKN